MRTEAYHVSRCAVGGKLALDSHRILSLFFNDFYSVKEWYHFVVEPTKKITNEILENKFKKKTEGEGEKDEKIKLFFYGLGYDNLREYIYFLF